jgi:hypothetical protein
MHLREIGEVLLDDWPKAAKCLLEEQLVFVPCLVLRRQIDKSLKSPVSRALYLLAAAARAQEMLFLFCAMLLPTARTATQKGCIKVIEPLWHKLDATFNTATDSARGNVAPVFMLAKCCRARGAAAVPEPCS